MMDALAQRTLQLAEQAIGLSDPNPRVGCVILTRDGRHAEGHTDRAGGPHAEAQALRQAQSMGLDLRGASVWVSLEPCSHHGRTPPCSQALVDAGVTRVHVAIEDPNPLVAGQGIAQLRAAGIEVVLPGGHWARAARELNLGFFSRMERQRPWVRMKIAASLDGTTALLNGRSQWITGPDARRDGHLYRRRASAVLTGIGTVRDDDPRLDVREVPTVVQPLRVVVDSRLEIRATARILQPPGRCLVYTAGGRSGDAQPDRGRLEGLDGVEITDLPLDPERPDSGKTDLNALMADLARRGVNELHVEAGEKLNGSLLRAGCVDELLVYLAPRLLGPGRGLAAFAPTPLEALEDDITLHWLSTEPVGRDLRVRALTGRGHAYWGQGPGT